MVDVPHIQFEALLPGQLVAALRLRQTGDAGSHLVAPRLMRGVAVEIIGKQRTRPHEAHVPAQDVPQGREFVEAGAAQEASEGGETFGVVRNVGAPGLGGTHAAELDHGEQQAMAPRSWLTEQHRASEAPGHQQSHSQQHR